MRKDDWGIEILFADDGFVIRDNEGKRYPIQSDEIDELKAGEELLWFILDFFNLRGSKHDEERLKVIREKQK